MDQQNSSANDVSTHLEISVLNKRSETDSGPTNFEPQISTHKDSSHAVSVSPSKQTIDAPEKKLTLFALRLAVLEKAATRVGTLGFIWATVVLLGGFAVTLEKIDFWFITIILLIEGTRIFSRSHELEWQRQATWTIVDAGISSFRVLKATSRFLLKSAKSIVRKLRRIGQHNRGVTLHTDKERNRFWNRKRLPTRTWTNLDVPLLPYAPWVFLSGNISRLLYWLQLLSATACVILSSMRLIKHNYGEIRKGDRDTRNRQSALIIFYALALAEALLFLVERVYWEWKVNYCKLLEKVVEECKLKNRGIVSVRRFFYDAYSKSVNGSIFDGLKMDMVSFGMDLLASNSPDEQLIGAEILQQFTKNEQFQNETLQKIGINISVIERLVEILNWKIPQEEEIRRSAAEILAEVASKKQNSLRVAGVPGAMESISSLLYMTRDSSGASYNISEKRIIWDQGNYEYSKFSELGIYLLKKLARDHDNCGKIGNTSGLLPKIIDFTHAGESLLKDPKAALSQIRIVKLSLKLVKILASTTGTTGKHLRKEISEIVFTISNIRNILRLGETHPRIQQLGIQILTSLALEVDAAEKIGGTGGVLTELFKIFFNQGSPANQNQVKIASGEALAMLALESKKNCHRIMKLEVMGSLVKALEDPLLRVNAARILLNLCTSLGDENFNHLHGITEAAPMVLKAVCFEEDKVQEDEVQEVMVGLAVHVFMFMTSQESSMEFERARITESELGDALVRILKKHPYPPINIPRIRRFVIELAIWMMRNKDTNIQIFRDRGMEKELHGVLETTFEIEDFNIFLGTVGVIKHRTTIHSLVKTALKLLTDGC